ncbi:MAG TPA: hypothetical protein VM656_08305 [Pyrinomonadaceae bacterium]|nr:hypothetical protein [Pyrinomonadaceae bacterium]
MAWRNPFAAREVPTDPQRADMQIMEPPTYAVPQHGAFSVPSVESGAPYNDEFGWGPRLRTSPTEIPSAQRLQTIPTYDRRPPPAQPPERFWDKLDADDEKRHAVEDIDANGWTERKGVFPTDKRWADNPRRYPPPEPRVTSQLAPRSYSFTRPFDQHAARTLNGTHFSMADHRRNYEILGMAPIKRPRNTYRLEPVPWDIDVVDMAPVNEPTTVQARMTSVELPPASRSYRLG